MHPSRSAGILLHPTSLPSGRIDREAHRFVDWLAAAGQSWWQVLPLGPPDDNGSPYAARSAFAASPGLLAKPDAEVSTRELEDFVARHAYWIGDWAAYAGGDAIADQVRFEREWGALRAYAAAKGVRLIGDLPIYVAGGSADHVASPRLFVSGLVAGAPPDDFSATGQLWGNPLYDWAAHRAEDYRWWVERFRRTFELVDMTRIDHFRGFVAYWAVPEGRKTAKSGSWRRGPGAAPFRAAERELGPLQLIAEDLGRVTAEVFALRDELRVPGMAVMQFAYGGSPSNPHRIENHREREVVYVATHDMDTARGWFESLPPARRKATGLDPAEPHWSIIEAAYSSPAALALVQAQDVLGLGSEARMNYPGRTAGNWSWRLEPGQLTPALARRLRQLVEQSNRYSAK
ncbi:MAG: 4-alpha-glucanotransferase [Gaiellaceae bacterium]|nr:4-alpha-glucanotransferase [Gaiellaceae bacterium]